jgi:hypothetical protein
LGGCGCSTVLLILCCGVAGWLGFSQGLPALLRPEIANNADVKEHLGDITSLKVNLESTADEQKAREGANNVMVFDAAGTKGNGTFITEMPSGGQGGGPFSKIELRLPDGTTTQIK